MKINYFIRPVLLTLFGLAILLGASSPVAYAATTPSKAAQIQSIMQQIAQLKEVLAMQLGQVPGSCTVAFARNLSYGSTGSDVLELQKFLNRDTETKVALYGAGAPGYETSFFGPRTKEAMQKFQNKYRSATVIANGQLDSGTRVQLQALCTNINGLPTPQVPTPTVPNNNNNNNSGDLNVDEADGNPNDSDIDVSTNNVTKNVTVLEADVEARNTDIELDDVYVIIESDNEDVRDVVSALSLRIDNDSISTTKVVKNGSRALTIEDENGDKHTVVKADEYYAHFSATSAATIDEDDTVSLVIRSDFERQRSSSYDDETQITFILRAVTGTDTDNDRVVASGLSIGSNTEFTLQSN